MSVGDLEAEQLRMAAAMPFAGVRALLDLGSPAPFLAGLCSAGALGRARVRVERGGRWIPDPAGSPRLILAVRDGAGELIDQVALASAEPDSWALRTGDGVLLGEDRLQRAIVDQSAGHKVALRLFSRPLDWLAGGGAGICVLDWNAQALGALRGCGETVTLLADDAATAGALREALRWGALPEVAVAGTVGARRIRRAA